MPTALGEGIWGNQTYRVTLKTQSRRYIDSSGNVRKTLLNYLFTFESSARPVKDSRIFASPEKRRAFLAESFTELSLSEIPEPVRKWERVPSPIQPVVGRSLGAVTSVMDYLQLDFPPYGFYAYNWPVLSAAGKIKREADEGYRDMLQDFIGNRVSRFEEYLDKGLTLEFADRSSISIPVKVAPDYGCPEVAQFWGPNICYFWQANEPPFD